MNRDRPAGCRVDRPLRPATARCAVPAASRRSGVFTRPENAL